MMEALEPIEINYSTDAAPTIAQFHRSDAFLRGLMGPFGCLRGDSRVLTEFGFRRISDLIDPVRVVSWNAMTGRFQLSLSGGSFPKGRDCLYRISTERGEFVASGHHLVLCGDHEYRRVDSLIAGDCLISAGPALSLTSLGCSLSAYKRDADRCSQKDVDYQYGCEGAGHRYDPPPHPEEDTDLILAPSNADEEELFYRSGSAFGGRMDDRGRRLSQRTHPDQSEVLRQIDGSGPLAAPLCLASGDRSLAGPSSRSGASCQGLQQFQPKSCSHPIIVGPYGLPRSSFSSDTPPLELLTITQRPIIKIERLKVNELYWDMQVLDTNNYLTDDGSIHHNSGKSSACVWEIIKRAVAQKPSRDGVIRSRWACVRETYPQLKDTTQKTFFDWLPPEQFGHWHSTDHNYTITKFPHPSGKPMEIEIMFRALELEKHVKNLLSLELTGAWINEARDFPQSIVNGIMGRVGRYPSVRNGGPTWHGVIADTNPPDDESWWYKTFEEIRPDNAALFRQPPALVTINDAIKGLRAKVPVEVSPVAENLKYLVKDYYPNLYKLNPPDWVWVYVLGQYGFVQDGRPVYPDYNDAIHTNEVDPIPGIPILRGWDFGLSPACVWSQVLPDGRLIFFDELVAENCSLESFAEDVKMKSSRDYPGFKWNDIGDPAGKARSALDRETRTSYDILRVKDIIIKEGIQTLKIRIESVKAGLNRLRGGFPGIQVNPRCKMVRKGFMGRYRYKKKTMGADQYKEVPEKDQYSHPHDCVQYIAADVLGQSITQKPFDGTLPTSYKTDYEI